MRDDFDVRTKTHLAGRVGWICSNPGCRQPTTGPSETEKAVTNVGVAAHITAASPDGPRFDPTLTPAQRRSGDNGLWLCQKCAKAIDDDAVTYTSLLLRVWKAEAEARARTAIEQGAKGQTTGSQGPKRRRSPERVLRMLIAEDDGSTAEHLARQFRRYKSHLSVSVASDGGEALDEIKRNRPDILLLDLMMPYGQGAAELKEESDPDCVYTGLRLLERIRKEEQEGARSIWVGVITARSSFGTIGELRRLLRSKVRLYLKPFDSLRLENDLVSTFGIPSKIPAELLGDDQSG